MPPDRWYPAGERDLTVRHVQLDGGEKVRVVEGGPPGRAPVLLVHGWGCSAYFFRKLIPPLIESGRRVVAIDLRGHGASDKPRESHLYTAPLMASWLESLMDVLDLPPVHAVAHSLGSGVTLDTAASSPARFRSLSLLAPVGLAPMRFIALARLATPLAAASLVPYAVPRWSIPLVLRAVYGDNGRFASRDVDEYWAPTADPAFALALRTLLHNYNFTPRTDTQLSKVTAPILTLFGGHDLLIRSRIAHARASAIEGITTRLFPRVGHVLAEEVPDLVLNELLPHLERSNNL
ncbi:MAG: alpha/beta fold hydrolase [Gemmatimonadota bacterium]